MDLIEIKSNLKDNLKSFLGYPCNIAYDYSEVTDFFNYHLNNVGSPYISGSYKANTKDIELEVIKYFANLWKISYEDLCGYITNGGTEGNLQGLFIGREYLGEGTIFYTSLSSHYSIFKIAKMLKLDIHVVLTHSNGEMNYEDFEDLLIQNIDKPALINVNFGTTMTSAIDNPREIFRILDKHGKASKGKYYIHADGALMGFCLPFLERDIYFKKHINSMSISGHKFLGIPFPCGVFMMEKPFMSLVHNNIEYIQSNDCTISGSRNGHSAIFFKYIFEKKTLMDFQKDIENCLMLAEYLVDKIPNAWRNHNSFTVVLDRPSDSLVNKWQLAVQGDIAHVIIMQHITKKQIDLFIEDYLKDIHK